jgi:hypothetical protein
MAVTKEVLNLFEPQKVLRDEGRRERRERGRGVKGLEKKPKKSQQI